MNSAPRDALELEAKASSFADLFKLYGAEGHASIARRAAAILTARAACRSRGLPKPDRWPDDDDAMRRCAGVPNARAA